MNPQRLDVLDTAKLVTVTYTDGHHREMAKWAHHRLDAARRHAEDEQRWDLADLNEVTQRRRQGRR